MCLYPSIIENPKYAKSNENSKRIRDYRLRWIQIPCGYCEECRRAKANEWRVRLMEEIKSNPKNIIFATLTFSEYELSGNSKKLEIGVGTTQSGNKQTYYYLLPIEKADYMTNGRILFGRGLRGRHFAFEVKISGEHCYINDLSIDFAATKRRV